MTEKQRERAEAMLRKFVAVPNESSIRHYLTEVSERNGVLCASDGIIAGVILPDGATEWDLSDAYIEGLTKMPGVVADVQPEPEQKGRKKKKVESKSKEPEIGRLDVAEYINNVRFNHVEILLSADEAKAIVDYCKQALAEYKAKQKTLEKHLRDTTVKATVGLDLDERIATTVRYSMVGKVANFNACYLLDALKFIQCEKEPYGISVYYGGYLSPIVLHSGSLYALLCPTRIKS